MRGRASPLNACICVFKTSVGFITMIESPPAVPPASTRL